VKLVVGLGNPGKQYQHTRHNVGFMVIDQLAKELQLKFKDNKTRQVIFTKTDNLELIKPQTFMNLSGRPLPDIAKKHKVEPSDILVVSDDIDMELGKLRYRTAGSSGGHRGLQSVIDSLGTDQFPRLKIGIGRPNGVEPNEYVTTSFSVSEMKTIKTALTLAGEMIKENFLRQ